MLTALHSPLLRLLVLCCALAAGSPTFGAASGAAEAPAEAVPALAGAMTHPTERVLTLDLTRNPNDIWDRIRRGFGMPDLDSPLVAEQQLFYLNRPAFLKQVFARGGRYLYHIVGELERRGMPTELALLPMVESSYNPLAYSRAHASGLWQFIPSTGKQYNLTQDSWVDERRDVIASTSAALDYLQTIYDMHGDWHLALASYNWGEGAVKRALQRNLDEGKPGEYSHLRMPDETRNYVPKLQAIKNIVMQSELFHLELPYVANELQFVTISAPPGIDLGTAAQLAGMSLPEFLALNPGFNRPAITSPGQTFIVPAERARNFEDKLAEALESGQLWRTHTLEPGERLEAVAERHGLTVAQLRQLNGLGTQGQVGAGHGLLVPDGIDPSGALEASRLLPFSGAGLRQQGLKLGRKAETGLSGAGRDPRLKFGVNRAVPTPPGRADSAKDKPAQRKGGPAAAKPGARRAEGSAPRSARAMPPTTRGTAARTPAAKPAPAAKKTSAQAPARPATRTAATGPRNVAPRDAARKDTARKPAAHN